MNSSMHQRLQAIGQNIGRLVRNFPVMPADASHQRKAHLAGSAEQVPRPYRQRNFGSNLKAT